MPATVAHTRVENYPAIRDEKPEDDTRGAAGDQSAKGGEKMKYMAELLAVATAVVLPAISVQAKPVSRAYQKPCKEVYATAKSMVSEKPYKLYSAEEHTLIFETGSFWKAGAQQMTANFEDEGQGCKVTANAPYSGFRRNGTVFLDRLAKKLGEK